MKILLSLLLFLAISFASVCSATDAPPEDISFPEIPRDGLDAPYDVDTISALQDQLIKKVADALANAPKNLTLQARADLIVATAQVCDGIHSATANAAGNVVIIFKDGTPFFYTSPRPEGNGPIPDPVPNPTTNNPVYPKHARVTPAKAASLGASAAAGGDYLLADKPKAILIDVDNLGRGNQGYLANLLQKKNYSPVLSSGLSSELRSMVQGVNFLWMASHSGPLKFTINRKEYEFFVVQIADPTPPAGAICPAGAAGADCAATLRQNRGDENAFYLFRGIGIGEDPSLNSQKVHWFMTRGFIQKYWKFAPESIAVMDICSTGGNDPDAGNVRATLHQAKAHTVIGWDSKVSADGAVPVIKRFVDRTLGTNDFAAVKPKHRPFAAEEVYQYLTENAYTQEGYGNAKLTIDSADGSKVALVPSIRSMEVDEKGDTLKLTGEFGSFKKKVSLGGQDAGIISWNSREILLDLPRSGPGSYGDTQVNADDRKSNIVPLTNWVGKVRLKMTYGLWGTPGPWTDTDCDHVRLRSDIHKFRDLPGRELLSGSHGMKKAYFPEAARETTCKWSDGGEGKQSKCRTIFVPNSGSLQWSPNMPEDVGIKPGTDPYFLFVGNIDLTTHKFIFLPSDSYKFKMQTYCDTGSGEQLVNEGDFGSMFNANGITQNWSALYPHDDDGKWNYPQKSMSIPDLQHMPNKRTLEYEFKSDAIPTDDTEA